MNYTLMHKDIPVADLTLDETTGSIQRIDALFRGGHLPVGVSVRRGWASSTRPAASTSAPQTGRVTAISESAGPFWMGNAA